MTLKMCLNALHKFIVVFGFMGLPFFSSGISNSSQFLNYSKMQAQTLDSKPKIKPILAKADKKEIDHFKVTFLP